MARPSKVFQTYVETNEKIKHLTKEKEYLRNLIVNNVEDYPSTILGVTHIGNIALKGREIVNLTELKKLKPKVYEQLVNANLVKTITFPSITYKEKVRKAA